MLVGLGFGIGLCGLGVKVPVLPGAGTGLDVFNQGRRSTDGGSDFFHKLGFKLHLAETIDLAIDIVITFDKTDILDLGADFQRL